MLRSRESTVSLLLIVALAGLALVISGCAPGAVAAPLGALGERSVTVLGRGMVSSKPDLALASLGVETFAATVAEATEQNNVKMSAVMAKLEELAIAEKDIQTANFSINYERRSPEKNSEGQYRVSNMVQVKVRNLDKVSSILDAAVQAGANQVWGVNFTIEEQEALEAQARTKAMEDARKRAEALAQLAGVQLGQVLIVAEGGTTGPIPMMRGLGGGMETAAALAPISPGEVQVSYQVEVTYAMQ